MKKAVRRRESGMLILFEGADGVGKATQTKLLARKFVKEGHSVTVFDFPNYESTPGKLIKASLRGKHGDFTALSPYYAAIPYSIDRALAAPYIRSALKKGIVIINRYTPSNQAFQGAKLRRSERAAFLRFVENLEYRDIGLPKPDLVIYLALSADASRGRLKKVRKLDQNEKNIEYQKKVRAVYAELARDKRWQTLRCEPQERPGAVHARVWELVRNLR